MSRILRWVLAVTLTSAFGGALAGAQKPAGPGRTIRPPSIRNPQSKRPRPTLALQMGHTAAITCLAFSPDGKTLATGSGDGTARLWDASSGQVKATLEGHAQEVSALVFSPDGKTLATGNGGDGTVRLWDVRTGKLRAVLKGPQYAVLALAFSLDGKTLTAGAFDGKLYLWSAVSGKLQRTASLQGLAPPRSVHRNGLAFSPDGKTLAGGTSLVRMGENGRPIVSGDVRLWDAVTGRLEATFPEDSGGVSALAFSPDGKTLASTTQQLGFGVDGKPQMSGDLRLWDIPTRRLRATLQAGFGARVAFSPDGKTLVTSGTEMLRGLMVRLWDARSAQLSESFGPYPSIISALTFSPDGRVLASGSGGDGTVRLWDIQGMQLRALLQGQSEVSAVLFTPDGKTLVTGGGRAVRLWDRETGQLRASLRGTMTSLSPDGKTLVTGSSSNAWLWDVHSGQLQKTFPRHPGAVTALAFSPDGRLLATGYSQARMGADGKLVSSAGVRLWGGQTGDPKAILEEQAGSLKALAFSPDGKMLASAVGELHPGGKGAGVSQEVRLWDTSSGQLKRILQVPPGFRTALAFSPDGKILATAGSFSEAARIWDTQSGQLQAVFPMQANWADLIAFSPDGATLAIGGARGATGWLWDVRNRRVRATLQGGTAVVDALAFSPDGKTLATRDTGGKVRLWDVARGKSIPMPPRLRPAEFPPEIEHPVTTAGAAASLHAPKDGRTLATLLPVLEVGAMVAAARPIAIGAKPISLGAKPAAAGAEPAPAEPVGEWFVTTPEGYFDCSANAARFIKWDVNGTLYPAERYLKRFRRPDLVRKALRGERITAAVMTADDIPPAARFVSLQDGDAALGDTMTVTVEALSARHVKAVDLLVNGRPLSPEQARPIAISARPIPLGAKEGGPIAPVAQQFTYQVSLPLGAEEIRLRAAAYDSSDLGSDPVEVVLSRTGAKPVAGDLYVLSVGVSRYRHGRGPRGEGQFNNLEFPAVDAQAIARRFQREGKPLYERVQLRTLTDDQAPAANIRAGLKWLQESVRPGQIDTVVIFLSGHGVSLDGRYYFATHETDLKDLPATTLSGRELREALGGKLRAKAVFLFVDTCHAGGLDGRNDDLALEVGEGVYVIASSGAKEYAYESGSWGHGAFTLALLRTLDRRELAPDGVIRFGALAYAVSDEVAALMKEAGRSESEQEPCVPLASRRLRVPIAQAPR